IGMLGVLDNIESAKMTLDFKNEGDLIYLIGQSRNDINSSEYLHKIRGVEYSPAPHFELDEGVALQKTITRLIREKWILSAHDLSEGGLITALFESAFYNKLGFSILPEILEKIKTKMRLDAYLFGEAQSRVVVSIDAKNAEAFEKA